MKEERKPCLHTPIRARVLFELFYNVNCYLDMEISLTLKSHFLQTQSGMNDKLLDEI